MFRIGEFSKFVRVSARMLRHYDKCGLFQPAEIDKMTGYRFYSAKQIPMLNQIIALRDNGFTVDEISEFLNHTDNSIYVEAMLKKKKAQVQEAILAETQKLERLSKMINDVKEERFGVMYDISIKEVPQIKVLSLRETIGDYSREYELWEKLYSIISEHKIKCSHKGEIYSIYHDPEHKEQDVDMEVAIPYDGAPMNDVGIVFKTLVGIPCAATATYAGAYEEISSAMAALAEWIEENGYTVVGNMRGKGIRHPGNEQNPQNYLTEIQIPVEK